MPYTKKDLISMKDLSKDDIFDILRLALKFKELNKSPISKLIHFAERP